LGRARRAARGSSFVDHVRPPPRGVAQDPPDRRADEELLLLEHRVSGARETLEVAAAAAQGDEVDEQGRAPDPEVTVARPFVDLLEQLGVPSDERAADVRSAASVSPSGFR
jgi:hypothetical protein